MSGAVKLIPKGAPMPVKMLGLIGGGMAGVTSKRAGQAFSDVAFSGTGTGTGTQASVSSKNSNITEDASSSTSKNSSIANSDNASQGLILEDSNLNDLDASTLFDNLIYSVQDENGYSLLSLLYSDNKVEVILSAILILNIIKFVMVLVLMFNLCTYYLSNQVIELKWLNRFKFISESFKSKLVDIINFVLRISNKSIKINFFILFAVMILCDVQSIYFLNKFINQLDTMCNYYINFVNS